MSNTLCKSWRALETTERGDIIAQELYLQPGSFPSDAVLTQPFLKSEPSAWDPGLHPFRLVLDSCELLLSLCHCPCDYPFLLKHLLFWLLSISFAGSSFSSREGRRGSRLILWTLFLRPAHFTEIWARPKARLPFHANGCEVYIPAPTAPQHPNTYSPSPTWHFFVKKATTELLISKPLLPQSYPSQE